METKVRSTSRKAGAPKAAKPRKPRADKGMSAEQPVVVTGEEVAAPEQKAAGILKNTAKVILSQDCDKTTKRKDKDNPENVIETTKHVKHSTEFSLETYKGFNAKQFGLWLLAQLNHYLWLTKLQGKDTFDMSLPIQVAVEVSTADGQRSETMGVKFSMSQKRLEVLVDKYPALVGAIFAPTAIDIATVTEDDVVNYGAKLKQVEIAKEIVQLDAANAADGIAPLLNGQAVAKELVG